MNCESVEDRAAGLPLWQRYADQFPVRERLIYLNHAAVAPLSKPAADAMKRLADDCLAFGSLHYGEWLAAYEGLRVAAAKLIGADRSEIALVKNTSEGIATVAMGLDWKPGDRMVGFREEFPANYFPWKRLEEKGIEVTWLSVTDSLDRIDEAAKGARLLAISFVQFLSGRRAPIQAIGEICRRNHMHLFSRCHSGARRVSARCACLRGGCAGSRRPQVAVGAGRVRHPLHKPSASRPRRAGGIRLDQRGAVRRLRLPRHELEAGCGPIRVWNAKYHWMLWIEGFN